MLLRTLLAFGFNAFLLAQTWPLASPGDWKVRPEWAGAPAVVLEDRTTFRRGGMAFYRKVLILEPEGARFGQADLQFEVTEGVKGRIQTPAGAPVELLAGTHIQVVSVAGAPQFKEYRVRPPKTAGPYIVELGWQEIVEERDRPIPSEYGPYLKRFLAGEIPVAHVVIAMDPDLAESRWRQWINVPAGMRWERSLVGQQAAIEFFDIPPRDDAPYGNPEEARLPLFHWYHLPDLRKLGNEAGVPIGQRLSYLELAAKTKLHALLMHTVKVYPDTFQLPPTFPRQLLGVLGPFEPELLSAKSLELSLQRIQKAVRLVRNRAEAPDAAAWDDPSILAAIKRGWASPQQQNLMAFLALKYLGANPSALFVQDRLKRRFTEESDLLQFDGLLVSYLGPDGQERILDLSSPGDIHGCPPRYQGTRAIKVTPEFKPAHTSVQVIELPVTPAEANHQRWDLVFEAGAERAFGGTWQGTGPWGPPEMPGVSLGPTPAGPSPIAFKGRVPTGPEGSGIAPFRNLPFPFTPVKPSPKRRRIGIELPGTFLVEAQAHLPWTPGVGLPEATFRQNTIGAVNWSAKLEAGGKRLQVNLLVRVDRASAPAGDQDAFEQFCGWMMEALDRSVPLP